MNAAEHRAEADRILQVINDHVDPVTRTYSGTQAELDSNIARAHVHALLALEPESVHRFGIKAGLDQEQVEILAACERAAR